MEDSQSSEAEVESSPENGPQAVQVPFSLDENTVLAIQMTFVLCRSLKMRQHEDFRICAAFARETAGHIYAEEYSFIVAGFSPLHIAWIRAFKIPLDWHQSFIAGLTK